MADPNPLNSTTRMIDQIGDAFVPHPEIQRPISHEITKSITRRRCLSRELYYKVLNMTLLLTYIVHSDACHPGRLIQEEWSIDEIIVQFLQRSFCNERKVHRYGIQGLVCVWYNHSNGFSAVKHGVDVNFLIAFQHQRTRIAQILGMLPMIMKIFLNSHIYGLGWIKA